VSTPDELIGITSDQAFPGYQVPQMALDDFKGWPTSSKGVYSLKYNAGLSRPGGRLLVRTRGERQS